VARIYTKTGDGGDTGLIGGSRVGKDSARIEAIGCVDEANAAIGVSRAWGEWDDLDETLDGIQSDLFTLGGSLATTDGSSPVGQRRAAALELEIDRLEAELEPLRNFVLPGGCQAAAALHVARGAARRAERAVVALSRAERVAEQNVVYLNRLSDLLFVMARVANRRSRVEETIWKSEDRT
jgi:cob(I)alamin adenosyltransferase